MIDKPFLLCLHNVFENVFTWRELTDMLSESRKTFRKHGGGGDRVGPKASREKEHLRRVKVIINMPEANKNFEASPSVSDDVEFFSISVCFVASFGDFVIKL